MNAVVRRRGDRDLTGRLNRSGGVHSAVLAMKISAEDCKSDGGSVAGRDVSGGYSRKG
jgi:hypothetical protein